MNFHLEHHIAELLYKSIRGELSDFERQELNQWRADSPMHETLFMRLQNDEYIDEELGVFIKGEEKNSVLWGRIRENMYHSSGILLFQEAYECLDDSS